MYVGGGGGDHTYMMNYLGKKHYCDTDHVTTFMKDRDVFCFCRIAMYFDCLRLCRISMYFVRLCLMNGF